ncbi:hypothetical protein HRI_002605800 [Hibiscus trionum]|uniref:Myb-like domain-containing protein n=1 Tax=Hibiscus trionum TaxID=183268 RepID=A0A9W7I890_HIBTR|nr:hypothetical protein HRI_002605800 [Hibiscus trionum]
MHPVKYGAHHHLQQQQQQQQFMADDNDSSSASVFFISNPQQQQQQQSVFPYPLHSQRQHSGPVTHQLFQAQFQPFQQQQQQQQPFSAVNFKLGLNENSGGKEGALPLNHRQNDATFWKPLNKVSQSTSERSKNLDGKYRVFGELEEIYGENSPANVGISMPLTEFQGHNNGGVGHGYSETTSIEKEASLRKKIHKKKRMKTKEESSSSLSSIAVFLETLVKQVSDHQECLHKSFMEIIERMDEERSLKEESWRRQEVERRNREAVAKAHEQALASSREALIVSYLEKITGETINLPQRTPLLVQPENAIAKADNSNSRWPIAEVETLIQVRCNLEPKFQEPGLKGPLWEEVSCFMSSFGYQRSAKRCKEKWENINKYFRKSKGNGKKRSQQSKTCSYFDQLDQLYSRIPINSDIDMQMQGDSDLVAQGSHGNDLENDGGEREDDDSDSNEEAE